MGNTGELLYYDPSFLYSFGVEGLRTAYTINTGVSLVVGVILNCLLIYLIRTRTSKEMQEYSRILLQTCFVDIFSLVVWWIAQPAA